MKISSIFGNMEEVPVKCTSEGNDVNPELTIENIPENAKSLAIVVDDPDSSGKAWVHWIVWDILVNGCINKKVGSEEDLSKTTKYNPTNEVPEYDLTNVRSSCTIKIQENSKLGMVGINDFKKIAYSGPKPPRGSGAHHYFFKVYALNNIPELRKGATREELDQEMQGHVIEMAELVGIYERK